MRLCSWAMHFLPKLYPVEVCIEVVPSVYLCMYIFEKISHSWFMVFGSFVDVNVMWWLASTNKFHLIPLNTCVPKTSTFPHKLCKAHKHVVSPLSISRFWPNSTCQLTLKCHNHWDVFLRLRCPGSEERREDDGHVITSLSSRSTWLAHARPDYRSWCWWRVTLRLPAVCYQEPPKTGSAGLRSATSPFAPVWVPTQVLVGRVGKSLRPGMKAKAETSTSTLTGYYFFSKHT